MKKRPESLNRLALCLLAVILSFPLQIMFFYGHAPWEVAAIFAKLGPMNWWVAFLSAGGLLLALRGSRWLVPWALLLLGSVAYNNYLVAKVGTQGVSPSAAHLSTLFLFAPLALLLESSVRSVFSNPALRWWLTPRRYPLHALALLEFGEGENNPQFRAIYATTVDIAAGGAFITSEKLGDIPVGARCEVSVIVRGKPPLRCIAEVVRKAEARGNYPAGAGIRFSGLGWTERRILGNLIRQAPVAA